MSVSLQPSSRPSSFILSDQSQNRHGICESARIRVCLERLTGHSAGRCFPSGLIQTKSQTIQTKSRSREASVHRHPHPKDSLMRDLSHGSLSSVIDSCQCKRKSRCLAQRLWHAHAARTGCVIAHLAHILLLFYLHPTTAWRELLLDGFCYYAGCTARCCLRGTARPIACAINIEDAFQLQLDESAHVGILQRSGSAAAGR